MEFAYTQLVQPSMPRHLQKPFVNGNYGIRSAGTIITEVPKGDFVET